MLSWEIILLFLYILFDMMEKNQCQSHTVINRSDGVAFKTAWLHQTSPLCSVTWKILYEIPITLLSHPPLPHRHTHTHTHTRAHTRVHSYCLLGGWDPVKIEHRAPKQLGDNWVIRIVIIGAPLVAQGVKNLTAVALDSIPGPGTSICCWCDH